MEDFGFVEKILGWTWKAGKLIYKIMTIGFRQGWGYFVLGLYLAVYFSSIPTVNSFDVFLSDTLYLVFVIGGIVLTVKKFRKNRREKLGIEKIAHKNGIFPKLPFARKTKSGLKKEMTTGETIWKIIIGFVILTILQGVIEFSGKMTILIYQTIGTAQGFWIFFNIAQIIESKKKQSEKALNPPAPPELVSDTPHGVIFGKIDETYIVKSENLDGHVLVIGGVGSGKISCVAIPSLCAWKDSVFAIDIKGELYEKTKHNRPNIKVFNPLDENSYGFDPFLCLHTSSNPSQKARAIAQAVIPLPHDIKDPFWLESAQNIFTGAILHYSGEGMSFVETIEKIQSTPPKALINEIFQSGTIEARYCVNSLTGLEDKTLSGIISELSRNIIVFVTDKSLKSALSRQNNISPDDLEFGNDVYINIPEHLLRQWKSLLTLIVNQFLTHFEQRSETDSRPILFLLDEFPRLGKVSSMLDGLATLRSKKIVICPIIQSLKQLDMIYGQNERGVILDTCAYKAVLGVTDGDSQEYFSKMAGTYDKIMTADGIQRDAYTGINKGTSTNTSEQERRRIKPEEFGMLKDIVLFTPFPVPPSNPKDSTPIPFLRVTKAPYYKEIAEN